MRFLVVGLGSMGKRRIRLLFRFCKNEHNGIEEVEGIAGVDSDIERRSEAERLFNISVYSGLEQALAEKKYDCAFIATSPQSHAQLIQKCLNRELHVFTELNLISEGYAENMELARKKNLVLFLSSTFLYRKEVQFIKQRIAPLGGKLAYTYHIGQYLPDWHPWESYKDFFIGKKETDGCREIFAIELPWLTAVFGEISNLESVNSRISELEIEYQDLYMLLLEHESGAKGALVVDVVSPEATRDLNIWGEKFDIKWKGTPDSLEEFDTVTEKMTPVPLYETVERVEGYRQFVIENAYYSEVENFIRAVKQEAEPVYSFEKDEVVLGLIDRIEGGE